MQGPEWPKSTTESYSPQGSGMDNGWFKEYAPGIAESGNLAHKWNVPGNHSNGEEPPSGMKGE